jgi:hypothetical protein
MMAFQVSGELEEYIPTLMLDPEEYLSSTFDPQVLYCASRPLSHVYAFEGVCFAVVTYFEGHAGSLKASML